MSPVHGKKNSNNRAWILAESIILFTIMIPTIASPDSLTATSVDGQEEGDEEKNDTTDTQDQKDIGFIGVNMRGFSTNLQYERYPDSVFPQNYYENSFRLISQAGMNLVRYLIYWEAYEKNPEMFMNELETVAKVADKYGLNIIYDNHQYQTSSWLDPKNGTGFPPSLFQENRHLYEYDDGGKTHHDSSKAWWTKWWERSVEDANGNDGWTLLATFFQKIVHAVDSHPSTLGYEILNEPQIHNDKQWEKIGEFNTFMVNELREITNKTIFFSQQIPGSDFADTIELTPENIAKMAPANKTNVVFKFTLYRLPTPGGYHDERFKTYTEAGEIAKVPVMIGEWNNVERVETEVTGSDGNKIKSYQIDAEASDIDQKRATFFIEKFEEARMWGWAYWNWNYIYNPTAPVNLITVNLHGEIEPTKYFEILENAISSIYTAKTNAGR